MQRALSAKNKLSFIDGSIEVLELLDLDRVAWERCNYLVHSGLLNSVFEPIAQIIVFLENACDVLIVLKKRFARVDRIRVSNLRAEIINMKLGSKSVLDYFTKMRGSWEELNICSARNFRIED